MKTFAQIVGGRATNVIYGDGVMDALQKSFAPEFWTGREETWIDVPDGTKANDMRDDDGSWHPAIVENAPSAPETPSASISERLDSIDRTIALIAQKLNIEVQ